jgi:hypothetical protein
MAHSYTVTRTVASVGGVRYFHVTIVELNTEPGSEWEATGLPINGKILLAIVTIKAGSASTVQPFLSRASGGTTTDPNFISQQSAAAAYVNDQTSVRYAGLTNGTLYGKSVPDAGSDNAIQTDLLIAESPT